jgi:hypothetical protein
VVGIFGTKSDARSIIKPQSSTLWLLLWNLKTFFSPNSINSIFADLEPIYIQKPCHFSITVTPEELGKINHSLSEFFIKWIDFVLISLSASIETNNFTGPTFGNVELVHHMNNGFFFPARA